MVWRYNGTTGSTIYIEIKNSEIPVVEEDIYFLVANTSASLTYVGMKIIFEWSKNVLLSGSFPAGQSNIE